MSNDESPVTYSALRKVKDLVAWVTSKGATKVREKDGSHEFWKGPTGKPFVIVTGGGSHNGGENQEWTIKKAIKACLGPQARIEKEHVRADVPKPKINAHRHEITEQRVAEHNKRIEKALAAGGVAPSLVKWECEKCRSDFETIEVPDNKLCKRCAKLVESMEPLPERPKPKDIVWGPPPALKKDPAPAAIVVESEPEIEQKRDVGIIRDRDTVAEADRHSPEPTPDLGSEGAEIAVADPQAQTDRTPATPPTQAAETEEVEMADTEEKAPTRRDQIVGLSKEGRSPTEIAAVLGITRGNVDATLWKARRAGQLPPAESRCNRPRPAAKAEKPAKTTRGTTTCLKCTKPIKTVGNGNPTDPNFVRHSVACVDKKPAKTQSKVNNSTTPRTGKTSIKALRKTVEAAPERARAETPPRVAEKTVVVKVPGKAAAGFLKAVYPDGLAPDKYESALHLASAFEAFLECNKVSL